MTQYRSGRIYLNGLPARMTPHEVRTHAFDPRRRGVDPDQVREFQARVADELTELHRQVRLLAQENDRLKRALRDWQTMHARECRPPNDGPW
ncbi:DivIVA domain-containing protein [Micromonospora echinospora]|uniref:Cell wall synthesis protein Wag31 n=1 Tax=Micromonospora echinospora TaxID=1877 RepID=A0ABR6MIF9_MICEC|nr:DivIVA domain-containing protein [Micromonospora echinospora]MBB5114470.1 DivIVA domain-containing protein [Micromonospora echinospora]